MWYGIDGKHTLCVHVNKVHRNCRKKVTIREILHLGRLYQSDFNGNLDATDNLGLRAINALPESTLLSKARCFHFFLHAEEAERVDICVKSMQNLLS